MHISLADIWTSAIAVTGAVLAYAVPAVSNALSARLKLQAGSAAADDLDQALQHGEGLLLDAMQIWSTHNQSVAIKSGPLANAVSLVLKLAPSAASILGITDEEVEQILISRVSKILGQPVTKEMPPAPAAPNPAG
ncbi:MAG: hypothetical protein KGL63_05845 [Betaproteobacteria bacterium]|nr:hypothetical protein [Betaproteobacteria bacterium]